MKQEIDYLNTHGARVDYMPRFFDPEEADGYWNALMAELEFNDQESSRVRVRGRWYSIPRLQTGYGDPGTGYTFAGCSVSARPWCPVLSKLRNLIQGRTGFAANFVLANLYRDGSDCVGWHSDDENDLAPKADILSLSLGATRDFQLRREDWN